MAVFNNGFIKVLKIEQLAIARWYKPVQHNTGSGPPFGMWV